jgi:hypothetical protein
MAGTDFDRDLDAEAQEALDAARSMPRGAKRTEALKKAGILRRAADAAFGIKFAKRGRKKLKEGPEGQE